ncbi:MAG: HIT domain-containing protein [Pseudomonadales bacterium]|nr:HIT domain-containing protein [Pseudomonadales bacterium]
MFSLDSRLQRDTHAIASLPLSELLLMNDSQYPWLILVPRRGDVRELVELSDEDQLQLQRESNAIAHLLLDKFAAAKLNIAALGNVVPQLHTHHIARYPNDAAWPAPVWGAVEPVSYGDDELQTCKQLIHAGLELFAAHWQV